MTTLAGDAGEGSHGKTDQHPECLAPLWHFGNDQPIKALAVNIPYSREGQLGSVCQAEEASWYRTVLGQPDPHSLLEKVVKFE